MHRHVVIQRPAQAADALRQGVILMPGLMIERETLIEAPVEVVWRTITEPDQISQWFADRVELLVEPGAHGFMQFGDQGGPVVVETSIRRLASHSAGTIPTGRSPWPATRCLSSSR
jgi:hypothetical protein